MKLNDPHLIAQTMRTHRCEVEVMYWMVEDAICKANQSKAEGILKLLLYIGKYKPELIRSGLQLIQRTRLKEMIHEIHENVTTQKREAITMRQSIQPRVIPFKLEKELQNYLSEHKHILEEAFGDRLRIVGLEVETDDDYRCDIVAESSQKFYPIELKIAQSTHAVVSQCSKYCYYFYRKLRYSHFKEVQGVVIINGADVWSINELRRAGHWIYIIVPTSDTNITLSRIQS
ncbi:hypothetical protein LCGC14_2074970 [marine sediment metagenome]|uniref:Uncharacterized protein n=1 Tax=marine sediment metagenome TaxID=412755 RepID=A0A0F9F4N2_9ZZZZ